MTPALARKSGRLAWPLAAALLCASTCTPLFAADTLNLCFENKMVMPWRTTDRAGLNFELLKRVEARLGITFTYQLLPWKRCLAKLKANEVDGAFSVSFSEERRQYGVFPGGGQPDARQRMHVASYFLIHKKGSALAWDGERLTNLNGKIAFQLGYSVGEVLRALKVPVDETNDTPYNVGRKVVTGRVAGAAMLDSDVRELKKGPLASELEVAPMPLVEKSYYLILSAALVKARPELAERIWKNIEEVRNGREYKKLVQAAGPENERVSKRRLSTLTLQ